MYTVTTLFEGLIKLILLFASIIVSFPSSCKMSLVFLKLNSLICEITGIEVPFLETVANKGVLYAILSMMVTTVLRIVYKGFDIFGSILIKVAVKYPKEKNALPPIGDRKILRESVTTIAEKIRTGQISAEEVVRTFIGRIHEVNSYLNAVVDNRFGNAIEEAKFYDKFIKSGELTVDELRDKYPLLGVPFTIKDSFCIEGLKHTAGLYYRKDITAPADAEVVRILKHAGAIPLGVTNVSELCMWWESVNTIYGRSNNPYDTRHITGGSSGGEASLQGAAGSAFGVGSDIGGSIRMPAFFCGVFGHKPTNCLVSCEGQEPKTFGRISEFLTTGPIVRHPEDMRLLLNVMMGPENRAKLKPVPENMSKVRIFYMEDDGGSPLTTPISDELKLAMRKTLKFMEVKYGVKPQRANIRKLYHSLEIWAHGMCGAAAGETTFAEELCLKEGKINPFWELLKYAFRCSPHTFPALILCLIEKVAYAGTNTPRHRQMIEMGYDLEKEIQEFLGDDAILVYPTHPTPAPRHHKPMFRPADFSYTAIFNILGVPVTQVPLGLSKIDGLPLGLQIVGGVFNDLLLMKISEDLRDGFGGWVPPCQTPKRKSSSKIIKS